MSVALDIRQALRSLRRHRGLGLTATLTLGLGIGAALAMAGIVQHVLLRPLPVVEQDRVLVSWGVFQSSGFGHVPLTHATMLEVAARTRVFERIAGVDYNGAWADVARVEGRGVPTRLGLVSGELFPTLGVKPVLGRTLVPGDDRRGAAPVAVLSEGLWERRYGRDPEALGKALELTNRSFTIVGVAPGDFDLPQGSEAWVTYGANTPDLLEKDGYATLDLVGRLRPGRTMEEGRRELDRLVTEIDGSQWSADSRLLMTVRPLADVVVGQVRPAVWVLGAAAVLVFLVAVLNLGNLLLVRGLERQREFAIRRAIGATRASLARQVVVESALLVLLGGATGTALAWVGWRVLPVVAPADFPRIAGIAPNAFVLLIALALGFLAVAIVSGLPALSLRESDIQVSRGADAGSAMAGSGKFAWSVAIAAQVTLAVVTLIASLLLVRTLAYLERLEPGFEVDDLGMAQIALLTIGRDTTVDGKQLVERLVERLSAIPGVSSVTTALTRPLSGTGGWDFAFMTEGQTDAQAANNPYVNYESARSNYFETLGLPILQGRAFEESDREGSPLVVIVSRSLARLVWPGQDPIGKRLRWPGEEEVDNWRTVVGVAADTRYREFLEPRLTVYLPARQPTGPWGPGYVLIRTERPFATLVPSLRQAAREVHPDLDLVNAAPLESVLDQPLARPRFNAGVLLLFSGIAVTLTAVGLYGLTSFVVVQRRREVGIRLALGAESRQIVGLFLRRGMAPVLAGAVAGLVIALAGTRVLASVLHGVGPTDPTAFVAAIAGFTLIALAAILVATRRAAGMDPLIALRTD